MRYKFTIVNINYDPINDFENCMNLTQEQIEQFSEIYLEVYGEELDFDTAKEFASRTINFLLAVYGSDDLLEGEE